MKERYKTPIIAFAIILIVLAAALIVLLPKENIQGEKNYKDFDAGVMDKQIVYKGKILDDHTTPDEVNNKVSGENYNLQVDVWPMVANDADGRDIVQYVNFSYDGASAQNISWVFMYSGQLEDFNVGILKTNTVPYLREAFVLKNITLEDYVSYTNLGSPTSSCEIGSQQNNTKMFEVEFTNGTKKNYCFTKPYIAQDTLEGYFTGQIEEERSLQYYQDVTNKVEYMGKNLLGNGRAFYKVDDTTFNPGSLKQTRWIYTPKNKALSGKWEIFAYSSNLGLQESIEQGKYLYIDPWWNASLTYRRAINGSNSNLLLPVNRSDNLAADSDVDDDGEKEVIYGVSNNAYVYYNDDTDTANANDTTEFCLLDSLNNVSDCPNIPTNQVGYFPFDFGKVGLGVLANDIVTGGSAGTGTLSHTAGVINNTYNPSDANGGQHYYITSNSDLNFGTGEFAIAMWARFTAANCNGGCWVYTQGDYLWFNVDEALEFYDGSVEIDDPTVWTQNQWRHVVLQRDSSNNLSIWLNGSYSSSTTWADSWPAANALICYNGGGRGMECDDLHIFKGRSLTSTEIQELYSESHNTYLGAQEENSVLQVNQNQPANALITAQTNIDFNCTALDQNAVLSLNLTIDGALNYTLLNSSANQNLTFQETVAMPDGDHTWFCSANSPTDSQTTSTRTLTVDTLFPSPVLTSPQTLQDFGQVGAQLFVNWTVTDANLDSCWYDYDGTNYSVTCNVNQSIINITSYAADNVTFWVNDTAGNLNSSTREWAYKIFLDSTSFESSTTEGSAVWFNLTLLTNSVNLQSAILNISNTAYTANADQNGYNFSIYRQIDAPSVSSDTNLSFYYNITRTDGFFYAFDPQNITVQNFAIDDCTVNNDTLYNFTMVDEAAQTFLNGTTENTTAEVDIQIYTTAGALLENVSELFTQTNPFRICLSSPLTSGESYIIDTQVQYGATNYASEFYNIRKETLDEDLMGSNITLYDLDSTNAQEFKLTYKDENFLPVAGATIQVQRKYISEGVFKVVEIPLTDEQGSTLAHLVLSDVIYTFVVIKDGVVLATFQNQLAKCNNVATGDCEIKLNEFASSTLPNSFSSGAAISFNIAYDKTTREVSSVYAVTSGSPATTTLNVTLFDGLGTTQVCTDTLISAGGTLTCTVPSAFENSTIVATLSSDGSYVGRAVIQQDDDPTSKFGASRVVLALLSFMILIALGVSESPVLFGIFFIIGIIFLTAMNLISGLSVLGFGATAIWMIVAIILIIIKIGRRQ